MTESIPRTPAEILAQLRKVLETKALFCDIEGSRLLDALPYEVASEFLVQSVTKEQWEGGPRLRTLDDVKASVADYMEFAWAKANGHRGLSALRSLYHFRGLAWLAGKTELFEKLSKGHTFYGKPQLVAVCEAFGIAWKSFDDDKWVNAEGDEPLTAAQVLATLQG